MRRMGGWRSSIGWGSTCQRGVGADGGGDADGGASAGVADCLTRRGVLLFDGQGFRQIHAEKAEARNVTAVLPLASGRVLIGSMSRRARNRAIPVLPARWKRPFVPPWPKVKLGLQSGSSLRYSKMRASGLSNSLKPATKTSREQLSFTIPSSRGCLNSRPLQTQGSTV